MPNEPTTRTAVGGATGIIGRAIAAKLADLGGWRVIRATRSGGTVLDGRADVAKLDIDQNLETAAAHGIRSFPTILIFLSGRVVDRIAGLRPATSRL